ncbi:MAG TPA: hypothetical protein ENN21_08075 [Spirochaetes bacterium]|nr:hypothetical protein [Spirochaetota bacterium]
MADDGKTIEIRLSRIPLFLLFCGGLFFLAAGLDIGFFHRVIPDLQVENGRKAAFCLFEFFMIGCGGLISLQMLQYLLAPAVMMRADDKGISFGTGFRYRPFTIPWEHVAEIGVGIDRVSLIANKKIIAGFQVKFAERPDIPMMKASSIGISYINHVLTLNWAYMDRKDLKEIIGAMESLKKRHAAAPVKGEAASTARA